MGNERQVMQEYLDARAEFPGYFTDDVAATACAICSQQHKQARPVRLAARSEPGRATTAA